MTREKPSISKLSRKVGEKLRRDKLNTLITNLAEEVPIIKNAQRRPDKLAILRLTVSYLKLQHGLKKRNKVTECLKSFGCLYGAAKAATNGVVFITTKAGTILYVSENIRHFLGYHQMDMIGYKMDKFIHEGDVGMFNSLFSQKSMTLATFPDDDAVNTFQTVEVHNKNKNYFNMRILYASKKKGEVEPVEEKYEVMNFSSFLDKDENQTDYEPWLVSVMKPTELPQEVEVSVSDFMRTNEFASLHDLDGTMLASDHRASLFHGFMPSELVGKSPYEFIIEEDLIYISHSHQLILKEDKIPVTVYRLRCRMGAPVFVETKSVIVCDKWTNQPKCIVSVHTAYSQSDGKKLLCQQKRRLAELENSRDESSSDNNSSTSSSSTKASADSSSGDTVKSDNCGVKDSDTGDIGVKDTENKVETVDCVNGKPSTSSKHEPLYKVYEQQAKSYPKIYGKELKIKQNKSKRGSSVKRPIDETEDVAETISNTTELTKSETKSVTQIECNSEELNINNNCCKTEKLDSETEDINEAEIQIALAEPSNCAEDGDHEKFKEEIEEKTSTNERPCSKPSQPILKGLLEGQMTVNNFIYTETGPVAMFMNAAGTENSFASSVKDNDIGAAGTSENDEDFKYNFMTQLHLKHSQLKDILFEQKNTVQFLRNQLALESCQLDQKNTSLHNSLLGKILEAENQIDVQNGLLREIEEELQV